MWHFVQFLFLYDKETYGNISLLCAQRVSLEPGLPQA